MKRISLRLWFTASQRRKLEIFIYMALLVLGCMAGTFFTQKYENIPICRFCIKYGMPELLANNADVFFTAVFKNTGLLILSMFFGLCAVGQPCLLGVLLFHSFSAGCCLVKLSSGITVSGIPVYIAAAAYTAATSIILLLAVRESVRAATAAFRMYVSENDGELSICKRLKLYFIRFGVLFFINLVSSGIYAVFCGFF